MYFQRQRNVSEKKRRSLSKEWHLMFCLMSHRVHCKVPKQGFAHFLWKDTTKNLWTFLWPEAQSTWPASFCSNGGSMTKVFPSWSRWSLWVKKTVCPFFVLLCSSKSWPLLHLQGIGAYTCSPDSCLGLTHWRIRALFVSKTSLATTTNSVELARWCTQFFSNWGFSLWNRTGSKAAWIFSAISNFFPVSGEAFRDNYFRMERHDFSVESISVAVFSGHGCFLESRAAAKWTKNLGQLHRFGNLCVSVPCKKS